MTSWKLGLGAALACIACCAVPLIGGAALVSLGAALSPLLACAAELLPLAGVTLAVWAVWVWRRRRAARNAKCGCSTACSTTEGGACR